MTIQLSAHFTHDEAIFSSVARRLNIPNDYENDIDALVIYNNVMNTAQNMETVRNILGNNPIHVDSWYRSPRLNEYIGGSQHSQHMVGEAVDFTCADFGTPEKIFLKLKSVNIFSFDQLILEHDWVHISFKKDKSINRRECLIAHFNSNGRHTTYSIG